MSKIRGQLPTSRQTPRYVDLLAVDEADRLSAPGPVSATQQQQYDDFVQLSAAQLAVATLDPQQLLMLIGEELDNEIGLIDQILEKSDDLVRNRA